jgi:hypothetical protein
MFVSLVVFVFGEGSCSEELLAIWNDCRASAPGSVQLGNQLYLWWGSRR